MKKHHIISFIFLSIVCVLLGFYYNGMFSLSWAESVGVNFYLTIVASTGSASSGNQNTGNNNNSNNNNNSSNNNNNNSSSNNNNSKGNNNKGNKPSLDPSDGNIKNDKEDKNNDKISTGTTITVSTGTTITVSTGTTITVSTGTTISTTGIVVVTGGHSSAEEIINIGGASQNITTSNKSDNQAKKIIEPNIKKINTVEKVEQVEIKISPIISPSLDKNNEKINSQFTETPEKSHINNPLKIIESSVINTLKPIIKNNIESFPILNELVKKTISFSYSGKDKDLKNPEKINTIGIITGIMFEKKNDGSKKTTKNIFNDVLTILVKNNNFSFFAPKKPITKSIYHDIKNTQQITNTQQIKNKLYNIGTGTINALRKNITDVLPLNGTVLSTVRAIFKYFK